MLTAARLGDIDYHIYHSLEGSPGTWSGLGAKYLGLVGKPIAEDMRNLHKGFAKDGVTKLVQNAGQAKRNGGVDLSVHVPKGVSVMNMLAPPAIQQEIEESHRLATDAMQQFLEETACFTRLGKGGHQLERVRPVVARFTHDTSRAGDGQLHEHLLFFNVGVRANGQTGSIVSKELFRAKMTAGAIYRAELAFQLRKRLGLEMEQERTWIRLAGIPRKVVDHFSKRRKDIESALRSRGASSARASEIATLTTRRAKGKSVDKETLLARWKAEAKALGYGWSQLSRLLHQVREMPLSKAERLATVNGVVEEMAATMSHFSERGLIRRVAETVGAAGWSAQAVREAVRETLASPHIIQLQVKGDQPEYTTRFVLAEERQILATATRLHKEHRHQVSDKTVEKVLARYRIPESPVDRALAAGKKLASMLTPQTHRRPAHSLSEEQQTALRGVTQTSGDLCILSGPPGSSKTTLIRAAHECWKAEGAKVIGVAFTGKAAQGLDEGTGIKSTTIHRALADLNATWRDNLKHHARQFVRAALKKHTWGLNRIALDKNTVVVCDEAGMCNSTQMAGLLQQVERARAKLVLVGDGNQIQAIERPGGFEAIAKRIGEVKLTTIVRQKDEWAREAIKAIGRGESEAALKAYAERNLVHVADNREAAIDALVSDWKTKAASRPESYLVLAPTLRDVDLLNDKLQQSRRGWNGLGLHHLSVNGERFYGGDRILFTQNSEWLGVKNGSLGTVEKVDVIHRRLNVRLDSKELVSVPLKHYEHVKLGYCLSVHKAQGITCDNVLMLLGGQMQDRELSYVMASRARGETRLYVDRFEAGEKLTGLAKQMNLSRKKSLAHDVGRPVEHDLKPEKMRLSR